jgi:hypothetical protein
MTRSTSSVRFFTSQVSSRRRFSFFTTPWRRAKLEFGPFGRFGSTKADNNRIEYNWINNAEVLE